MIVFHYANGEQIAIDFVTTPICLTIKNIANMTKGATVNSCNQGYWSACMVISAR